MTDPKRSIRLAKVGLGLSLVFALVAIGYFTLDGRPLVGVIVAIVLLAAGIWEYHAKVAEIRDALRRESDADTPGPDHKN